MRKALICLPLIALLQASYVSAQVQDVEAITADKDRIVADKDRIIAKTDQLKAAADNKRARVEALGLPEFDNKTTLKDGAGRLEALILAADALGGAATRVRASLS